jgi:hypothetical protein
LDLNGLESLFAKEDDACQGGQLTCQDHCARDTSAHSQKGQHQTYEKNDVAANDQKQPNFVSPGARKALVKLFARLIF